MLDPVGPIRSGTAQDVNLLLSLNDPAIAYSGADAEVNNTLQAAGFELLGEGTRGGRLRVVHTAAGGRERHAALIVATGFNSAPVMPDWPGSLDGPVMHTHDYRQPDRFAGRDVVVVGIGSSAIELSCEISRVAKSVTIVTRRGNAVIKRWVGGVPADLVDTELGSRLLPWSVRAGSSG